LGNKKLGPGKKRLLRNGGTLKLKRGVEGGGLVHTRWKSNRNQRRRWGGEIVTSKAEFGFHKIRRKGSVAKAEGIEKKKRGLVGNGAGKRREM